MAWVFLGMASPAHAENHALLVGVSSYPSLPAGRGLQGPRNDVALMWNVLTENGFDPDHITVLADTLDQKRIESSIVSNAEPTKAAIVEALSSLPKRVESGDFVYIHFSGHGAMQPEIGEGGDEDDGLDEFFLPIDIGSWSHEIETVENALVDDELAPLLSAIREQGAFVWIVFDQCNAGTATRGGDDIRTRAIDPEELGISLDLMPTTRGGGSPSFSKNPLAEGEMVAFYAVHPGESALERRLPRGKLKGANPNGVFTYAMAQAIRKGNARSYRDLSTSIQQTYRTLYVPGTPLFEGDLDRQVFGQAPVPRKILAETTEAGVVLQAGMLDGITEETILALYPLDGDAGSEVLGYAYAYDVTYTSASLTPDSSDGHSGYEMTALPDRVEARVVSKPVDLTLRVAIPDTEILAAPEFETLAAAIHGLADGSIQSADGGANIEWVSFADEADYYLQAEGDYVRFITVVSPPKVGRPAAPSLQLHDPAQSEPLFGTPEALARDLYEALQRLAKARNLFQFAEMLGEDESVGDALVIVPHLYHDPRPLPALSEDGPADNRPCKRFNWRKALDKMQAVDPSETIKAGHCDVLIYELRNEGEAVLDVTGLYVDRAGGISVLDGEANPARLEPGAKPKYMAVMIGTWNIRTNSPMTIGLENVAFIAVEQKLKTPERADFSFLVQPSLAVTKGAGTRGGASDFALQLQASVFPDGISTRQAMSSGGSASRAEIRSFTVNVSPPE
jgi:hypothetical protein